MIIPEKTENALRVIQRIIILARKMAYDEADHIKIASVLDDAEYLPGLLLDEKDRTKEFRKFIVGIGEEFGWHSLIELFDDEL